MLESKLIKYLADNTAYPVSNETPRHKPREYILVQRTAGGVTDLIKSARYAVKSISAVSKMRAAQMNEVVKEVMEDFETDPDISQCSLNSDYDFTNPVTKEYRYQAVFDIVYF